eukprot:m.59910 g.59910  ORF g.59910 m.59910 type:complete len:2071 (+) comp22778_c0_seq1:137-6349(+)
MDPTTAVTAPPVKVEMSAQDATADAMDYDDRILPLPADTDTVDKYLTEGFWPVHVNVFSDFGVSVNFFVDGDALLANAFEDTLLDWEHGGQPLQVIYRVNKFLQMLLDRRAHRFHVLFFSDAESCWSGSKLVVRQALIRFLKSTTEMNIIEDIKSIWDPKFITLSNVQQPAFCISKRDFTSTTEATSTLALFCQSFVLLSLNMNQSVMLIDDVEFEGPKMKGWTLLERPFDTLSVKLLAEAEITCQASVTAFPTDPAVALEGRVSVAVATIKALLATDKLDLTTTELCKLFLVHVVLLDHFPPSARAAYLPKILPDTAHLNKLPEFFASLWGIISSVVRSGTVGSVQQEATMCDLWDGRFFTRLIIATRATSSLGVPEAVTTKINAAITASGLAGGLDNVFSTSPEADIKACADCMAEMTETATVASFTDEAVAIPSHPVQFLQDVAQDGVTQYGGVQCEAVEEVVVSQTNAPAKVEEVKDAADSDDDIADDWDASSDEDAGDDDDGGDKEVAVTAVANTKDVAVDTNTVNVQGAPQGLTLAEITNPWKKIEVLEDEGDAYNTQVIMRHMMFDGDQARALTALKKFVGALRKRLRGRLSDRELEDKFHGPKGLIAELNASEQTACAQDLENFYRTNRFGGGLEKIIVRKWQGRMKPQRMEQSTLVAVRDFAKSLLDRVIQTEVIVEADENAESAKASLKGSFMSAGESIKKTVKLAIKRKTDLDEVLERAEKDRKRGTYAEGWLRLDDFLLDRCVKDDVQYRLTDKAILNLKDRTKDLKSGAGGKGKKAKGAKKGGKGQPEEEDDITKLLREYDAGMKKVSDQNVTVLAWAARLKITFTWWREQYARHDVVKAASEDSPDKISAEMADAMDNEHWACGQVVAELFKLNKIALAKSKLTADLAVALATYLKQLGFPKEAALLLDESIISAEQRAPYDKEQPVIDRKGQTLYDFQMANMGPLLLRKKGSPDARVRRFQPDVWQKELLDAVDTTGKWRRGVKALMKSRRGTTVQQASEILKEKDGIVSTSILVSAPTSSGKTFISFYAMEQILREASQGDGVVVYVSPTKALVNQVEADLYARYDKSFQRRSTARSLHGVFTKEYRTHVHDCQILITVPECLEIVLMDKVYAKTAARIRWVIFDEVHCISKDNGAVWERLLVGCQANFIALSATIGNPEDFAGWLNKVEEAKGHQLKLVKITERYNDLSVSVYNSFESDSVRESDLIVPINPLGALSVELIQTHGGVPEQTKFLPEHCWEIIRAVKDVTATLGNPEVAAMVAELDLQTKVVAKAVSMSESAEIEGKLKMLVWYLVQNHESVATELMLHVSAKARAIMAQQDETISKTSPMDYLETNLLSCLRALDAAGQGSEADNSLKRLPAIVFHLSVRGCTRLVQRLTTSLEDLQHVSQARSFARILLPEYKDKCEQEKLIGIETDIVYRIRATEVDETTLGDEELRKAVEMSKQSQAVSMADIREFMEVDKVTDWTKPVEASTKVLFDRIVKAKEKYYGAIILKCGQENDRRDKDYEAELAADPAGEEFHTPPAHVDVDHLLPTFIDKRYSFLPPGQPVSEEDLKEHLGRWYDPNDFKTKALQRGIGLHYLELPRKYKNAVERLFRLRKLKVVIATSTLALGINMPCKTVVMAGDEPHLNAMEYHQMIGRAGRRTFDNRGNVVFIGTPSRKIRRLLSSNVADLVGNVPLTPGLALRLFCRYRGAFSNEDKDGVAQMARRLMTIPFFAVGGEGHENVHVDQLLFCIDMLMHSNMRMLVPTAKGDDVEPTGMCMFLAHMYFLEPYNFVVMSLMQRGVFDKIIAKFALEPNASASDIEKNLEARNQTLLHVLAYVIHPHILPKRMRGCATPETSDVRLKPLPNNIVTQITDYNKFVLERFSMYMRRYATVRNLGNADVLPGDKKELRELFVGAGALKGTPGSAIDLLTASVTKVIARTPFVALSGHADKFASLPDLLGSLREGMYLDRALVPILPEIDQPVNSFLLDFYRDGERQALSQKNGLRDHSLFDTLSKVSHAIRVIKDAQERRIGDDVDAETRQASFEAFEALEVSFTKKFRDVFAF